MSNRTKKQHFSPRFYLRNFTNETGELWTHDSERDTLRQTTPENTGYETNIYSPTDEDGNRIDFIEDSLSKIEGAASAIMPDLLSFKALDLEAKTDFSVFMATMFARSPAQLRQFAAHLGEMADWMGSHMMEQENRKKNEDGRLTAADIKAEEFLKNNYTMNVDRRVGLIAFEQTETLAAIMVKMNWTFEISNEQELITSDNSVFWVNGGPAAVSRDYGFGLGHPQAVVPFPLSPNIILRLDRLPGNGWTKHRLDKSRAKLANQYQAKHKNRFLYFQNRDEGFRRLGMKYAKPVQQLSSGLETPQISVVRKLRD